MGRKNFTPSPTQIPLYNALLKMDIENIYKIIIIIMDTSPFLCPAIWWRIAPDHPRAILHQTRRPDCRTAKGILYSHSPAINTEKG